MIEVRQNANKQIIRPTIFPDGTSQVWKLDLSSYKEAPVKVIWHFEHVYSSNTEQLFHHVEQPFQHK